MSRFLKRSRIVLTLALLFAAIVSWLVLARSTRVTILDDRFRVLTVKVSKGTNHFMFHGRQIEGTIRERLRSFGIGVKTLPKTFSRSPNDTYAFIVRYTGELPAQELRHVHADLCDPSGAVVPLRWQAGTSNPAENKYLKIWVMDSLPTNRTTFTLRLRLGDAGGELAKIPVGRL
jgi:hypothetical protein